MLYLCAELNSHVTSLIVSAKQLDAYLGGWLHSERADCMGAEQQLAADVSALESELRQQQRLLAHYSDRMSEWAERYRQLEASNDELQDSLYAIDEANSATG